MGSPIEPFEAGLVAGENTTQLALKDIADLGIERAWRPWGCQFKSTGDLRPKKKNKRPNKVSKTQNRAKHFLRISLNNTIRGTQIITRRQQIKKEKQTQKRTIQKHKGRGQT